MSPLLARLGNGGISGRFGFGQRRGRGSSSSGRPITITMWGAGGGGWVRKSGPEWGPPSSAGGTGGSLIARTTLERLGLTSGSQLYIYVGGGGTQAGPGGPNGGHPGGGGLGNAGYTGGGGGMSAVYMNGPFSSGTLLLISGGGGGGSIGNIAGLNAEPPTQSNTLAGGGTQSSGGGGGSGTSGGTPGSSGSQFTGGNGGTHAGGGGAGYYGGGGGGGDNGAAQGAPGGSGSSYINTSYFVNDTSDSGVTDGVVIANIFRRFPTSFNPPMPFSGPPTASWPYGPLYFPGPYSQPAGNTASDPFPGQNAAHPLYNVNYGGGTISGGNGYPGSVHITVGGTTYSYTTVGTHILTIP